MPIYSFGVNSIMKLELTEEEALRYNRFTQAFFDAQTKLRNAGTPWDPRTPLLINYIEEDKKVWDAVGEQLNTVVATINQDETPIVLEDDFLVKN